MRSPLPSRRSWATALILLGLCAAAAPLSAQAGKSTPAAGATGATATPTATASDKPGSAANKTAIGEAPLPAYTPPTVGRYGPSGPWMAIRTLFSLGLVVGLIYLTAWAVKARGTLPTAPVGYRLRVIETASLGSNRSLHLVAVGRQVLLLGAGGEGVSTLATFSAEEIGYDPDADVAPAESFMAKLQAFRGVGVNADVNAERRR